jgi:hypothetical protein
MTLLDFARGIGLQVAVLVMLGGLCCCAGGRNMPCPARRCWAESAAVQR